MTVASGGEALPHELEWSGDCGTEAAENFRHRGPFLVGEIQVWEVEMRTALVGFALGIITIAGLPTIVAQSSAKIARVNDHRLLSDSTRSGSADVLYYEVCNHSKGRSAFVWKGAGFGVDARSQLPTGFCAHKRVFAAQPHGLTPKEISFQGGSGGKVDTWMPGRQGLRGITATLDFLNFFTDNPDDVVQMETMTLTLTIDPNTGGGTLVLRTSEGVQQLLVAFPSSNATVNELKSLFGANPRIEISTFEYFRSQQKLTPGLLSEGISDKSPVISVCRDPTTGTVNETLKFGDVGRIGELAAMLAIDKDNRLVARNDVAPPAPAAPR